METLIAPSVNLAILIVILYKFARIPVRTFVKQRHETVKTELETVIQQLQQAQAQFEEFTGKLKAVEAEVEAIRSQLLSEARDVQNRIISQANHLAKQIIADSKRNAQNMVADLQQELRRESAARVLEKAESILKERLTGKDRERIRREFSMQMENVR